MVSTSHGEARDLTTTMIYYFGILHAPVVPGGQVKRAMLKQLRFGTSFAVVLMGSAFCYGSVGYEFGGAGGSGGGSPFHFAVSSTSGNSLAPLTSSNMPGGSTGAPGGGSAPDQRTYDLLHMLQRPGGMNVGMMGGGGGRRGGGNSGTPSVGTRSFSPMPNGNGAAGRQGMMGGMGGFGGGVANDAGETTSGDTPVSSMYCYCVPRDNGGPGTNGPGTNGPGTNGPGTNGPGSNDPGSNDPGHNGPGGGNPNDPSYGGGGPSPSVVPEPGSVALWVLAGTLLIAGTRRRG